MHRSFAFILWGCFLSVLSVSTSLAQIGMHKEAWKDSLALEQHYTILSIADRTEVMTYTLKSKQFGFATKLLYYYNDTDEKIVNIYSAAFYTYLENFVKFIQQTHPFKMLGKRTYTAKTIYEFESVNVKAIKAYAYFQGGLCHFTTEPEEDFLVGKYTFEKMK